MNEEERQALESLRKNRGVSFEQADIISNLINKQQKEIEELKAENKELINQRTDGYWENDRLKKETERLNQEIRNWTEKEHNLTQALLSKRTNSISKDKIKEILGIEEDIEEEKILSLLQTIVDECNRLEEVEDRKVQVEVDNIEEKRDKYWKDKIRKIIYGNYEDLEIILLIKELLEE